MANEVLPIVHPLSSPKRGRKRKLMFGPNHTWLARRRDGASDNWQVAWYDPGTRQVRYRSTRTTNLIDAKRILSEFQLPENAQTLPPKRGSRSMQVYFIGGDTGAIKIGIARDPERRLATLQCGSPIKLRIMASGPGSHHDERTLHARFAEHRLHGEWFSPAPEILTEIDRINRRAAS